MRTRPSLSWSDLSGARVGVWGLGVEGTANVAKLLSLGAEVVIVDEHRASGSFAGLEVLPLRAGGEEALGRCEAVVKTPGVSRYRPEVLALEGAGIPVLGGVGLWLQETDRSHLVCITGTKGKSTTTALTGHLIGGLGGRVLVTGNIGSAPWAPDPSPDPDGGGPLYVVVEISSYQATDVAVSPPVVAVTNLGSDHLDWHGDLEHYHRDKLSLCTQPGAELTIAGATSPELRARAALLGPRVSWVEPGHGDEWMEALELRGAHNRRNAAVARACAEALGLQGSSDAESLRAAAAGFDGLESRLLRIGEVAGVEFVDDSLSTNVLPTVAALDAFAGRRVALIVGGYDRGIEYEPLAEAVAARSDPVLAVTLPASGPRIARVLAANPGTGLAAAVDCPDLDSAVARAFAWARPDGVVLLSPAAPSFGQFRDYKERAAAFRAAMVRCRERLGAAAPQD